jgi:hypothetical protein
MDTLGRDGRSSHDRHRHLTSCTHWGATGSSPRFGAYQGNMPETLTRQIDDRYPVDCPAAQHDSRPAVVIHVIAQESVLATAQTDEVHGERRPSAALADFIRCRDLTCRFPGCDKPADFCDLDHTVPYDAGGPTHASNLKLLCRKHHLLKPFGAGPVVGATNSSPTAPSGGRRRPAALTAPPRAVHCSVRPALSPSSAERALRQKAVR